MSKLHLLVVSGQVCVVEGYFLHNKVPLVVDVPAEITIERWNNAFKTTVDKRLNFLFYTSHKKDT